MEKYIGIKVNTIMNRISFINNSNSSGIKNEKEKEISPLPKDFFESVLECEVKLKQKFNIKIFQKLAYYYSAAIAYYESINDPKYVLYNQNLSLLFSQTEAKKYLAGGKKKAEYKKENLKKKLENCEKKINGEKVKNIIKRKKNEPINTKIKINNLIEKEMNEQQNDFKKRLAEKKKRYELSISDNMNNNNFIEKAFKNVGINNSIDVISANNESLDFVCDKELKLIDMSNINSVTNNTFNDKNSNKENSSDNNNIQIVINTNDNDILNGIKNGENSFDDTKIDYNFNFEKKSNGSMSNKNIKYTNKTKFIEKMKFGFELYSNDYYDLFIKKISGQIIKDCKNIYNELTQALTDITVNSINQEKELEYLLTSDSDDAYTKEIKTIIKELKEEDKIKKEKLISENIEKMGKIKGKYSPLNTFQFDHDIEMMKKKLKLDITKSLNTLVFK